jgi:hypothetical protein
MPSAVADALLPAPVNPAQPPQGFWGNAGRFAYDALGLGDVAKALQGRMTPNEAQDFAFGAALGLIPMSRGLKPVQKGIRAYHGSPHDFDRFDMSKIGTGEGAQAYGHGLYFAENKNVAQEYRRRLSPNVPKNVAPDEQAIAKFGGEWEKLVKMRREAAGPSGRGDTSAVDELMMGLTQRMTDDTIARNPNLAGRMYEVNINAHPDQFLDWDKPLAAQPGVVQDLARTADLSQLKPGNRTRVMLEKFRAGDEQPHYPATGHTLHNALEDYGTKPRPELSRYLNEQGIPGIKYLDQGSRTAGDGSRNYVVFDDKLIDIIKKYGLAALGLPPAMTAGSQIWNSQTQQ